MSMQQAFSGSVADLLQDDPQDEIVTQFDDDDAGSSASSNDPQTQETTVAAPPPEQAPVVLAKDGVHTIPYAELETARARAAQADALAAELERLKADQQAQQQQADAPTSAPAPQFDPDTGLTEAQSARLREMEDASDFSTSAQAKAQLFVAKCHAENGVIAPQQSAELKQVQAELNALKAEKLQSAHELQILASHPDAASIVGSTEFTKWIDGLPSYARAGALHVHQNGSATEVNQLLSDFKASIKPAAPAPVTVASKAAAAAAISRAAKPAIPASLSDVAAGVAAPTDPSEALDGLSGSSKTIAALDLSDAAFDRWFNKRA